MLYWYFTFAHDPFREMYYIEELAFWHSLGYMIYNMFPHYYNNTLDIFIFWHHAAAMLIFVAMLSSPRWIYLLTFVTGVAELTHPCHVTRIIFDSINEPKISKRYLTNLYAFGALFLILRAYFWTIHFYEAFTYKNWVIIIIAKKNSCIPSRIQSLAECLFRMKILGG